MSELVKCGSILSSGAYRQEFEYENSVGHYDNDTGRWVVDTQETLSGFGSIQPVPRRDLHDLMEMQPEGEAFTKAILIITEADLVEHDDDSCSASVVLYKNSKWKVIDVEDYREHGHIEAIAFRLKRHD